MTKKRPWEGIIPAEELETYRQAGFGTPVGLGNRPALLVIDTQYRSVGTDPTKPISEAIKQYPTACGTLGWRAVPYIAECIAAFRERGLPVIYAYVAPKEAHDHSQFAKKVPGVMGIDAKGYEFIEELAPREGEILLPKHQASAFAGTALLSYLVKFGVDSLVFTGVTTSGCVRASVVDAAALNYRCAVPEDAVYDRSPTSHAVNLFDMASKYADVMPTAQLVEQIRALP
jgi:nicotinamidase-related amidase